MPASGVVSTSGRVVVYLRRYLASLGFREGVVVADRSVYLFAVIVMVGEGGIHVGQREVARGGNLIGTLAATLVPQGDASSGNAR